MIGRQRAIRVVLLALAGWSLMSSCGEDEKNPATPTNDPPTACFLSGPSTGTTETVFSFDPSCSIDREDSTGALVVRWDWEDDAVWDTDWSAAEATIHQYDSEGRKRVRLEVRDSGGLVADLCDTLDVGRANVAPGACFSVAPDHGTMAAIFEVDASCSDDPEDAPESLQVRWDWENDGSWDTEWTRSRMASHRFPTPGHRAIRVQVRDSGGLTDAAHDSVAVGLDYLGRESGEVTASLFAPPDLRANASWFWHGSPSFSPDGREMFFTKYVKSPPPEHIEIHILRFTDGGWGQPQLAPFSDPRYSDNNPFYSSTGDTLYFVSRRNQGFLHFVTRTANGWSDATPLPVPIPAGMGVGQQFSLTRSRTLYAELETGGSSDIYRWEFVDGGYAAAERLGSAVNTAAFEFMPFIDPQERFLLYCSQPEPRSQQVTLYVSRRGVDGSWSEARAVGHGVNIGGMAGWPWISPDGNWLFFGSDRASGGQGFEPYWVDTRVLTD